MRGSEWRRCLRQRQLHMLNAPARGVQLSRAVHDTIGVSVSTSWLFQSRELSFRSQALPQQQQKRTALLTHACFYSSSSSQTTDSRQANLEMDYSDVRSKSPSASTSNHVDSSCNVHPELVDELRTILEKLPEQQWMPVAKVYQELSMRSRRDHLRPHRTLGNAMRRVQRELGLCLSQDKSRFLMGSSTANDVYAPETPTTQPPLSKEEATASKRSSSAGTSVDASTTTATQKMNPSPSFGCIDEKTELPSETTKKQPARAVLYKKAKSKPIVPQAPTGRSVLTVRPSHSEGGREATDSAGASTVDPGPVDFFYKCGLEAAPVPPSDFVPTPSALAAPRASDDGAVLSLASFVPYIPPFFIPLDEALKLMPGYTEQHVQQYLSMRAVEIVSVGGRKFIRIFGGYGNISLDTCTTAEDAFARYKPDPNLALKFVPVFKGIYNQWMPLKTLFELADPALVARLPFRGYEVIVFFAQMQHLFNFAVDESGGALLLREPNYSGLECETSPVPKVTNKLLFLIPMDSQVDISFVRENLSPELTQEMLQCFPSLEAMLRAHKSVFYLSDDGHVVMRTRYKARLDRQHLSLEEQLEMAIQSHDKKKMRSLRRKIAFQKNPNHPFLDPDNLAREVARYLPQKGHIPMKVFLKKNVPEELLSFLPLRYHRFFVNYSQYFQIYEYVRPNNWCVSRQGLPIPRGVIRQEFSEEDLVRLIAEYLQQRGPKSCSSIIINVPRGALDAISKHHGSLYHLVCKYPQYFNVVLSAEVGNVISSAVVHLVNLPDTTFQSASSRSATPENRRGQGNDDDSPDENDEDE